jgi:RNA polymerase sigma factor (sigma-70 family)
VRGEARDGEDRGGGQERPEARRRAVVVVEVVLVGEVGRVGLDLLERLSADGAGPRGRGDPVGLLSSALAVGGVGGVVRLDRLGAVAARAGLVRSVRSVDPQTLDPRPGRREGPPGPPNSARRFPHAGEASRSVTADEIHRVLAARVVGYLRARGVEDPEDVAGEVFLQVARDLSRFRGRDDPDAVRRWVFTIARHRMADASRRARRRPRSSGTEVPDRAAPDRAEPIDPELLAALAHLTPEQREVLALRFVADLPLEDVARLTKRSVGATKALQHRALENLRRAVSPDGPTAL